jgi:hypothetical protein
MTDYPKAHFSTVESLRKHYEAHPTAQMRDDLAWWVAVLASKVAEWALQERKDKTQ